MAGQVVNVITSYFYGHKILDRLGKIRLFYDKCRVKF